jgi:tetratricopeptide (TPR) repeat protein
MTNIIQCKYCGKPLGRDMLDKIAYHFCPFCGKNIEDMKVTHTSLPKEPEAAPYINYHRLIEIAANSKGELDHMDINDFTPEEVELLINAADALEQMNIDERRTQGNAHLWYQLGLVMEKLEDPERAEIFYRVSLEIDDQSADAWWELGVLTYYNHEDADEALKCFENSIAIDPNARDSEDWLLYSKLCKMKGCEISEVNGNGEQA